MHPEPEQVELMDLEPMNLELTDTELADLEGVGIDWVQGGEAQRGVLTDGKFCLGGETGGNPGGERRLVQRVPEQMPA